MENNERTDENNQEPNQEVQTNDLLQNILESINMLKVDMETKQKVLFDQHKNERINEMRQLEARINANIVEFKNQSNTANERVNIGNNIKQSQNRSVDSPGKTNLIQESKNEEDYLAPWTERIRRFSKPKSNEKSIKPRIVKKTHKQPSSPPDSSSSSEDSSSDSSTESPISSNSESDNEGEDILNLGKRLSFVGNLKRNMEGIANNQPLMYQLQPDFSDILLKELTPKAAMYFFKAIDIYQRKYNCSLKVATMVAPNVAEILIAENKHKNINDRTFYSLSSPRLLKIIQKHIRPKNVLTFLHHLITDIKFYYKGGTPDTSNFQDFYTSLLLYKDRFEKMFDFLAEKNGNNIPNLDNKPGGILKVFLDKIPYKFGSNVLQGMKKKHYETFHKFLKCFMKEVKKTSKLSELLKESDLKFGSLEDNLLNPMKKHHFQNHQEIVGTDEFEDSAVEKSFMSDPEVKTNLGDIIQALESEDSAELNVIVQPKSFGKPNPNSSSNTKPSYRNNSPSIQSRPTSNSTTQEKKKDLAPNGCFHKIMFDNCKRGDACTYSHDREALVKTHQYYTQLLRQSKYQIQNDVTLRKTPGSISVLEQDCNDEETNLSAIDMEMLQNVYLNVVSPTLGKLTAMHREGIIQTSPIIEVDKILFDSGALHSSYAAKELIDANRDMLEPYIKKWKGKVRLGDNKTTMLIDEIVVLPIVFYDDDGVRYEATVSFCIFDTSGNDLIIGLPDIASKFPVLFKKMIDAASDQYEYNDQCQIVQEIEELKIPWSKPIEEIAQEELDTPVPCSFTAALHFMELTHQEAVDEFKDQITLHVNKDFAESTDIVEYLLARAILVFVPEEWTGINGIPPLELNWKESLPGSMKPRARPVNPRLYDNAKKEFDRLCQYLYESSTSPLASCLVIAPKATAPYIRFCGDYVEINKHISIGHSYIPNVQHEIVKIKQFKIFLDIDMTNSFHQFRLDKLTSERLSIQTPWGQVQPKFMPEGIGPASGVLQEAVRSIFKDFSEEGWCIAIFDNVLLLAYNFKDAYEKFVRFIERCIERNVYLKFSKSWLGFSEVKFFGYLCKENSYGLTEERKEAINSIPFPSSMKQMQSFLGSALFFKAFVPNYSEAAAPLNDMVRKDFNWDSKTWKRDYMKDFDNMKKILNNSFEIYYPDYNLSWILRSDASEVGVGAALFQIVEENNEKEYVLQPIGFASQKLTTQARKWSTIEQEAYGLYFAIKTFSYYLHGKFFILETDHNNLVWIEASQVAKIIRWRIYMQGFVFLIRHIPRKQNMLADYGSKYRNDINAESILSFITLIFNLNFDESLMKENLTVESILKQVHGGRMGHHGRRKTWLLLNDYFPGHKIPYSVVDEFVGSCAICQKDRLGMTDNIQGIIRHLKPSHIRSAVGVDTLTVTPPDKDGNWLIIVVVVFYTKFAALYPAKAHDATTLATALFQFFCTYGLYDDIYSDPGSDLMSEVVEQLHKWLGIRHIFSLVDRHESNGVEGTNKQILRHLKALVHDERIIDKWSSPTVLPLVQFMINSNDNSETGVIPLHAHFGTAEATYFRLPEGLKSDGDKVNEFVKLLDQNIKILRSISSDHQQKIINKRTQINDDREQNKYQKGDLVLFHNDILPNKLSPKFTGPYEVIEQTKNDVQCRHLVQESIKYFHVDKLKIFHGNYEDAYQAAKLDFDQFTIKNIIAYRGEPMTRTTMEFEIEFEDNTIVWLPWTQEISQTIQFEDFCRAKPALNVLLYSVTEATKYISNLNKKIITSVKPGEKVFVDLRCFGATWYQEVGLEDPDHINYVVEAEYVNWLNKNKTKINMRYAIFEETYPATHSFVLFYGGIRKFDPLTMRLVDAQLVLSFPLLLPESNREKILSKLKNNIK